MHKKRLIFTLLISHNLFQLSRNFKLQQVGDLEWLLNSYHAKAIFHSIDELIVLNVSKEEFAFEQYCDLLKALSRQCFVPIAAGGNITSLAQAKSILSDSGADKVVLNTALFSDSSLVYEIADVYGEQSIIASVDYKVIDGVKNIYIKKGSEQVNLTFCEAFKYLSKLPIGELYLTSIDHDGTGRGYDMETIKNIQDWIEVPIIISGGVGQYKHLCEGMLIENVTGVSTANLFNFIGDGLLKARDYINMEGISIATWDYASIEEELVQER